MQRYKFSPFCNTYLTKNVSKRAFIGKLNISAALMPQKCKQMLHLYAVKAFTEDTSDFTLRDERVRINRLDKSENIDRLMSLCQHHDYLHRLAAVASCSVNKRSTSVYVFYDSLADLVILL